MTLELLSMLTLGVNDAIETSVLHSSVNTSVNMVVKIRCESALSLLSYLLVVIRAGTLLGGGGGLLPGGSAPGGGVLPASRGCVPAGGGVSQHALSQNLPGPRGHTGVKT